MRSALLAALCACTLLAPVSARAEVEAETVWARPTTSQAKAGAVFLTLRNTGPDPDRLIGAETPAAERIELHTHVMDGGVARMREVEGGIDLPAGQSVVMQPGGLHLMLFGLRQPLAVDATFPVTLVLEKGGRRTLEVRVAAPGKEPAAKTGHGTGHQGGHGHGH